MKSKKSKFFANQFAITSLSGAGSSTQLTNFQSRMEKPFDVFSGGAEMRSVARSAGMDINTFTRYNRDHPEDNIDKKMDTHLNGLAVYDNRCLESRLAHILWPGAFKVYLHCDINLRAERRRVQQIEKGGPTETFAVVKEKMRQRDENDNTRYAKLYGPGCLWTPFQYDVSIDSGELGLDEVFGEIVTAHSGWLLSMVQQSRILNEVGDDGRPACYPQFKVDIYSLHIP